MLKVNSVRTVCFVGNYNMLLYQLTIPVSNKNYDNNCFYYRRSLYRVEKPEDAGIRIVTFSACDIYCCFDLLLELVAYPKSILYLTDVNKAKKIGIKIDRLRLSYMLQCPVVFATPYSARGLNKLLNSLHIIADTPRLLSAIDNTDIAKRKVLKFRKSLMYRIIGHIYNLLKIDKRIL